VGANFGWHVLLAAGFGCRYELETACYVICNIMLCDLPCFCMAGMWLACG
jgi:hypothetical protein